MRRAREKAGVEDKGRGGGGGGRDSRGGGGVLGKRRRDGTNPNEEPLGGGGRSDDDGGASDTDPDARDIPMPTDHEHEPPVPSRRRPRVPPSAPAHAGPHALPAKPGSPGSLDRTAPEQKTVYAAAPQLRDLRREAVKRFVPAVVAGKLAAARGEGGRLVEPEEADRLEREGYRAAAPATGGEADGAEEKPGRAGRDGGAEQVGGDDGAGDALEKLEEEERRFRQEAQHISRQVQVEEVEDEDL